MVWGLFLLIYGEQVREGFDSHMLATYSNTRECDAAAYELQNARRDAVRNPKTIFTVEHAEYVCAPIPKQ
jgi:hypothetical protein